MNLRLLIGFSKRNLSANRYLEVPFIFSVSGMLILFNIMSSLLQNKYVQTRHKSLSTFINMGIIVAFVFTFIFVVYANRFLIKRRNREFALYGILGLEKKHIRIIILAEHIFIYAVISVISIIGGFVFGKLAFLGLNRLLSDIDVTVMDYPFSAKTMIITLVVGMFLFIFTYILNTFSLRKTSPCELLCKSKEGEREPKIRIFILLSGITLLIAGYYIAITITGVLQSLTFFFVAVILVIVATYLLFISFSIFVLKMQKRNKDYYYRAEKFLSISGMLYKMKSSATGLASIAVLSTGIVIALSSTLTIYNGIEELVKSAMPREYLVSNDGRNMEVNFDNYKDREKEIKDIIYRASDGKVEKLYSNFDFMSPCIRRNNELIMCTRENFFIGTPMYIICTTLDTYNSEFNENVKLDNNEVLFSSNSGMKLRDKIILAGKSYKVRNVGECVPKTLGIEAVRIFFSNATELKKLSEYYVQVNLEDISEYEPATFRLSLNFNLGDKVDKKSFEKKLFKISDGRLGVREYEDYKKDMYELDGGFLFLGIIVGLIFMSGTMLITYYKQISEGTEDKEKIQIMKKLGLPDELIKKTANSQIVWMFFLPLIVAMLHSLVSSKIIFQLLAMFGIHSYLDYGKNLVIVGITFAIVYFINFKITVNVYYKRVR